jgi:hypothetical protein
MGQSARVKAQPLGSAVSETYCTDHDEDVS